MKLPSAVRQAWRQSGRMAALLLGLLQCFAAVGGGVLAEHCGM
jgi:hypothetical protein